MTDMRAQVSRAICKAESEGMGQGQTCDCDGKTQTYHYIFGGVDEMRDRPCPYRNEAKAAIKAMLMPTDFMMEAGLGTYGHNPDMPDEEVEQIWQVMALAALEGKDD